MQGPGFGLVLLMLLVLTAFFLATQAGDSAGMGILCQTRRCFVSAPTGIKGLLALRNMAVSRDRQEASHPFHAVIPH